MRIRKLGTTAAAALSLALLLSSLQLHGGKIARPQVVRPNAEPKPKQYLAPLFPAKIVADDVPASPWVTVAWGLNLNANNQALYQNMATLLSGDTAVPQDRTNFFSAIINDVDTWKGVVTNVQAANGGGYTVTVFVQPSILPGSPTGSSTIILSNYSEIYNVDANNNITYAGFLDPSGQAGKMFTMLAG